MTPIPVTAVKKVIDAQNILPRQVIEVLRAAAASAPAAPAAAPVPPPVTEDDEDEGVSMEGTPAEENKARIQAAPAMERTPVKVREAHALIRDRQALRRAVILSEILSPPLSKRR